MRGDGALVAHLGQAPLGDDLLGVAAPLHQLGEDLLGRPAPVIAPDSTAATSAASAGAGERRVGAARGHPAPAGAR